MAFEYRPSLEVFGTETKRCLYPHMARLAAVDQIKVRIVNLFDLDVEIVKPSQNTVNLVFSEAGEPCLDKLVEFLT